MRIPDSSAGDPIRCIVQEATAEPAAATGTAVTRVESFSDDKVRGARLEWREESGQLPRIVLTVSIDKRYETRAGRICCLEASVHCRSLSLVAIVLDDLDACHFSDLSGTIHRAVIHDDHAAHVLFAQKRH